MVSKLLFCIFSFLILLNIVAQESEDRKNSFYVYWGWNRGFYSNSDITFKGDNYNFTLDNVVAKDRQSPFDPKLYFSPTRLTIPQYNFRIGYFITDKYNISIGADHMKYVMVTNQMSKIDGQIANSGTEYDGTYSNQDFQIKPNFLLFEHTDGLNYENIEIRRVDDVFKRKNIRFSVTEGAGIGMLIPRTNTTLLNNKRYDEFHIAGFGFGLVAGINFEFFKHFFILSEAKFGYINMPDIRTTEFKADRAKQQFFFSQFNGVFGVRFKIKNSRKKDV